MRWFRFYTEALNDPKVQSLRPELFKVWVNLLCLAATEEKAGDIGTPGDAAFALRASLGKFERWLEDLVSRRLVDQEGDRYIIHNWPKRQPPSDNSTPRVKALRDRDSNGEQAVTSPLLSRPRTEQSRSEETRTEKMPASPSGQRLSVKDACDAFLHAESDPTGRLVDLGDALGLARNGGLAVAIVRDYGHGQSVVDAILAAASKAGGNPWEYAKGALKNGRTQASGRPAPRRGAPPVTDAADMERAKREF